MTPKTIQIFLPSGDPSGIRIAEITTRIVQAIEVPRSLLSEFLKMSESKQVALYFLIGDSEDDSEPKVYIGQTGDLRKRLIKHNKEKDFWERALILISRTNSLTQTHALFLEWHCLQETKKAARYADENGNDGTKPHTPPPLEADCLEIFDTGKVLMATLGYPVFDPVAKSTSTSKSNEILYCKASGADARGLYTQEGFVVLKDSIGRLESKPSFAGCTWDVLRQKMVQSGIMREERGNLVFTKDHLFKNPSMAAAFLVGRNANGWKEWKDKDGKTLDALKRRSSLR